MAENHSPVSAALRFFFLQAFLQKSELSSLRKQKLTPVARRVQANNFRRAQPDGIGAAFVLLPVKPLPPTRELCGACLYHKLFVSSLHFTG